jgi:hypothetical protein
VSDQPASLSFASWLRQGLAASIDRLDGLPANPAIAQAVVDLQVQFNQTTPTAVTANPKLTLVGPGDIVGLDTRVIVRAWPKPDDNDAEFGSLALVEFDQADLPWRYTAAAANNGQLRPWMTLLVLKDGEGQLAPPTSSVPATTVTVTSADALPDLSNAWAFAHTQFAGASLTQGQILSMIGGAPGQFVSRILCPRALEASTRYTACLVPTFQRGALIGTGQSLDNTVDALALAWSKPPSLPLKLPVYYSWKFQTGTVGSFKQLALLIQPQPLPADVGRRVIDVSSPGLALPSPVTATPKTMLVEGALQSLQAFQAGPSPWSTSDQAQWVAAVKQFLDTPTVTVNGTPTKVVAPPLYGQWYAAQGALTSPAPAGSNPPWFYTLDSDPRPRVGADLGAVVVQNNQDSLLASAWNQVGDLRTINGFLRVAQLGREVCSHVFQRHVASGTPDTFWTSTGRLQVFAQCNGQTMCQQFTASPVDAWVFDPAWRRLARPLGPVSRFQGWPLLPPGFTSNVISRLNSGQQAAPDPPLSANLFTPDLIFSGICFHLISSTDIASLTTLGPDLLLFWGLVIIYTARQLIVLESGACFWQALRMLQFGIDLIILADTLAGTRPGDGTRRTDFCLGAMTCADVTSAPAAPNFVAALTVPSALPLPPAVGGTGAVDTADAAAFRAALCTLFTGIDTPPPPRPQPTPVPNLGACQVSAQQELDPQVTITRRFQNRLTIDPSVVWKPADALQPIFAPPTYQQPMYQPLAAISSDWILPGLNEVGRNTAALALTNQRFVEAYMVGINDEMTRALRWNEFPVDQRATYFRQFWDITGIVPPEGSTIDPETLRDILPIATWSPTGALGTNSARAPSQNGSERLVLVVRAQLIQRYPNVIVYAVPAQVGTSGLGLSSQEIYPVFNALIAPDVAFYGFEIPVAQVTSIPGYFFVLQEQPGEPKFGFGPEPNGPFAPGGTFVAPPSGANTSGVVATSLFVEPFRIAIHGSLLLPPSS